MNELKRLALIVTMFFALFCVFSNAIASTLPKVLIITTGGTISTQITEKQLGGFSNSEVRNSEVRNSMQDTFSISSIADTQIIPFSNKLSKDIAPNDWVALTQLIEDSVRTLHPDGIVITHDTNTIEETASFLDLVLNLDIPVVLTGEMRLVSEIDSDGPSNLYRAIKVAISEFPHHIGVVIAFDNSVCSRAV